MAAIFFLRAFQESQAGTILQQIILTVEKANKLIDSFAEPLNYFYRNGKMAGGFGGSMFDYNNEASC